MTTILNGKELSQKIIIKIKEKTSSLIKKHNIQPGLAVILIGEDPSSQVYVRSKHKLASECSFHSLQYNLQSSTSQDELLNLIQKCNQDPLIHGILVQLPLPLHINKISAIQAIDPEKDVDGFHYKNIGKLATNDLEKIFIPCTPAGIIALLNHYIPQSLAGLNALIIGRSNIVGRPMAQLLLNHDATVTIAHGKTKNLADLARQADLLISATGYPHLVQKEWVKPNSIVVDVGINRIPMGEKSSKLVGDVHFEEVKNKAAYITPVPGGVGPMTIAMLMLNTLNSACYRAQIPPLKL